MDGACPKSVKPAVLLDSGGAARGIIYDVQSGSHRKGDVENALSIDTFIKLLNCIAKYGELRHVIRSRQVPDAADKGGGQVTNPLTMTPSSDRFQYVSPVNR